ncbi:MAG: glycosyltransferase family 39 protein [Candidatus Binatia bacterium]
MDAKAAAHERPAERFALGPDVAIALVVVAVVTALQWPVRLHGVSPMDEGGVLQVGADLLRGRRLYADAVMYAFPGIFWLAAGVFAAFGATMEVARATAVVVFAATCGVVYLLARWSHGRRGALAMVVLMLCYRVWAFPHWQMLNYSSLAVGLSLAALWLAGEAVARDGARLAALAGVVVGLAVLVKQDSGGASAVALGLGMLAAGREARRRLACAYVLGGALVAAAAVGALWATGSLDALVHEALLAPLYGAQAFTYQSRPSLWPLWRQDPALRRAVFNYVPPIVFDAYGIGFLQSRLYRATALVDMALKAAYYLPWVVVLASAVKLGRHPAATPRRLLLVLEGVACLAAFNRPHDWAHLVVLYPVTLLLGAALLAPLLRRPFARAVAWSALGVTVLASFSVARAFTIAHAMPVHATGGTLYTRPLQAEPLQDVLDALATAPPDTPLLSLPYYPLLNFLAARPTPTRYYAMWPVDQNPHRDEEVIADLERRPDALVVYSANEFPQFPRMREFAPRLAAHLADGWEIARTFGGEPGGATLLLLGRAATPAGASLLGEPLAAAHVAVEPAPATTPARDALVAEDVWPSARVVRVTTLPQGTVTMRYPVTPSSGDRFETACGVDPERFGEVFVPPVWCAVAVAADGAERDITRVDLDPLRRPEDRGWVPMRVDLSPWAGRPVEIVLRAAGPPGAPSDQSLVGFADPRIVHAPR